MNNASQSEQRRALEVMPMEEKKDPRVHSAKTAARTAKKSQIAYRRKQVAALVLQNVSQKEIAERLQVSDATVSKDVHWLREQWLAEGRDDIAQVARHELMKLDRDEMFLRAEYSKVTQAAVKMKVYDRILAVMKRRHDLLGLDKPKRTEITGRDGGPIVQNQTVDFSQFSTEDLRRLADKVSDES